MECLAVAACPIWAAWAAWECRQKMYQGGLLGLLFFTLFAVQRSAQHIPFDYAQDIPDDVILGEVLLEMM